MATVDPVILQLRADNEAYVRDIRQSTAIVEQQLGRQEVAVVRHGQTFQRSAAASQQAMRNLGFQISDIGTQLAAGSSPFLILAQQGPQVANALEGTRGVAGRLATFFSGPWGAALLAAASVVGVLTGKLLESGEVADKAVTKYGQVAGAAERLATQLERIRDASLSSRQRLAGEVTAAQLELAGLEGERARIASLLTGGPGEAEGRGRLAILDKEIAAKRELFRQGERELALIDKAAEIEARANNRPGDGPRTTITSPSSRSVDQQQRALEASLRRIAGEFDPALEASIKFRDTIKEIDALEAAGLIAAAEAAQFRWSAAREQAEAVAKAANEALGISLSTELVTKQVAEEERIKKDSAKRVADEEARLREDSIRNLANLYESLLLGGTQNIWDTFKRLGIRVISETLASFTASGGKGGIGGAIIAGIGAVFGGGGAPGRASGGYVGPRQTVRVNEQAGGVELLRMGPKGGTVIPLGQINQQAARPGQMAMATVRLELSGDLNARIQQVSGGVALEVVRSAAPTIIDASARETTARLTRTRI